MFVFLLTVFLFGGNTLCDNFPSLLTTNATLAVVLDHEFLKEEYENIKSTIESYLTFAKRDILKHGGVNVVYYSWTAINVKRDLTAILSVASCSDTWRLFKAAESEFLLHMAVSEADCPRLPPDQAITIPLLEKGEEMPQMLLDLRTTEIYNWKSAVLIYDNIISDDMLTRVIKSLTKNTRYNNIKAAGISLMKLEVNNSDTLEHIQMSINSMLSTINPKIVGGNFLVIVEYELVEMIMEIAKRFKLVNTKNQWLYVIPNTNMKFQQIARFKRLLREGDNVAFLHNTTETVNTCEGGKKCHTEEVLTGFCKALETAIIDEFDISTQVSEEEWEAIRPTKLERRNTLLSNIKKFLLDFGTCDNCTSWKMRAGETWGREYQVQTSSDSQGSLAELLSVGSWRPSDGPSMTDELFPHISHGFRRKTLPLVSVHNPPWQILKTNESGHVIEYKGLVFDIMRELAKNLNFTYTVEIVKSDVLYNSTRMRRRENSSNLSEISDVTTFNVPTDILEMVHNKSFALGACAFTVTEENKKLVDFTIPVSIQPYTILVARPRELSRALLFISPFSGDTWLCLSAAIISMGPILYYIHKYSPVYEYKGIRSRGGLSTIQNCIWYMYGALLQQGGMHLPQADSARILVGSWWLVVLVIATTYCGNLVAFLTFPKIDIPITTIDELIAHKETVSWSFGTDSYLEEQLKLSTDSSYKTIYNGKTDIADTQGMIQQIKAGKHVYLDWKIKLQYIMRNEFLKTDKCDLALGADDYFDEIIALIIAPESPYLTTINEEIWKLHQVGLINKWLEDYLPKKDRCWKKRRSTEVNNHTVNMDDMQGSFFVLFFGFFLSFLIIICERIWSRRSSEKKKQIVEPFTS